MMKHLLASVLSLLLLLFTVSPSVAQEKAWEFLIFELGACAIPDSMMPMPPPVPPPGAVNMPPGPVTQPPAPPPPPPPPPPPMVD